MISVGLWVKSGWICCHLGKEAIYIYISVSFPNNDVSVLDNS